MTKFDIHNSRVGQINERGNNFMESSAHVRAAAKLHMVIVIIVGLLASGGIAGAIYAINRDSQSPTEFTVWGTKLSTGHVSVALFGIGLVVVWLVIRSVLKSVHRLAALPHEKLRNHRQHADD